MSLRVRQLRARATAIGAVLLIGGLALVQGGAWAHAFVSRSEPPSGSLMAVPLSRVRIWFDGPVERSFLAMRVEDRDRQRVDKGDAHLDARDATMIEVGVPALQPGRYRVFWSVIARDGHRRDGDFSFRVK